MIQAEMGDQQAKEAARGANCDQQAKEAARGANCFLLQDG